MTGADVLAQHLAAAGCRRAFGIPGGEVLALLEALDRVGIRFVLTKHENAAGFMAEGAWHADGSLPLLVATLGPGVANAVNVVANAMQERVPLLFVTGCVGSQQAERYTHQVFDHQALLRPIVKASLRAQPDTVGLVAEKALAIALDGQPGPVHIDLPVPVAEGETEERAKAYPGAFGSRAAIQAADGPGLNAAREAIAGARRPLALAGVDAVNADAGPAITAFCGDFNIPLVTTYKAKGLMDENVPLAIGGAGLSPRADAILRPLIATADCIVLIGYDPIEMRAGWCDPWGPAPTVVEITPVLRTHGMHRVTFTLRGDIVATLAQLTGASKTRASWVDGQPAQTREALREAFLPSADFGPGAVFAALRESLPRDTVATADSGAHRILLSQMWRCPGPRHLLQSAALCTMGSAVPLAVGYKLAAPGRPVVAFVGDAGLEMGLGELATLRDLGLCVLIVVLVDTSLALIEMKQRGAGRGNLGVDFGGTDFPAVARALGGHGAWIDDIAALQTEAHAALGRDGFTLLAARIGSHAYDGLF